jgi:hypothetical protein
LSLPDISLAVGDTEPAFVRTWVDEDGNEVDLTGFAVVFNLQDQGRANAVISGPVVVTNTPSGVPALMTFSWPNGSTAVAALYDAEFVATKSGAQMSWPQQRGTRPDGTPITLLVEVRPHV